MKRVCTVCYHYGETKSRARHSFIAELAVWIVAIMLLVPTLGFSLIISLGYTLWRAFSRYPVCEKCGSHDVIPISTPRAQAILRDRAGSQPQPSASPSPAKHPNQKRASLH